MVPSSAASSVTSVDSFGGHTPYHVVTAKVSNGGRQSKDRRRTPGGRPSSARLRQFDGRYTGRARPSPPTIPLRSYDDLVTWSVRTGLVAEADAARLRRRARGDAAGARRVLARALELRDRIYTALRPMAEGREPDEDSLAWLREAERDALASARLGREGASMRWTWPSPERLEDPLRPIVHSAVELLTEGPLDRLKVCGACRWLFLDQSKNRSRRWCSMSQCGTAVKQERFVEARRRRRAAGG